MDLLLPIASLLMGSFAAIASAAWVNVCLKPRSAAPNSFERARRERLRESSLTYRWLEPLVEEIATLQRTFRPDVVAKTGQYLSLSPESHSATSEEFLAIKTTEGLLLAVAVLPIGIIVGPLPACVLAAIAAIGYSELMRGELKEKAVRRKRKFKQRLPFALDMMALMMSAGATFQETLDAAVNENKEHPLGEEFGTLRRELSMGRSRKDALQGFSKRLDDDDVRELVFAVTKGDELGTPLSHILSTQAAQLRLKRSQWAEKASAEAQVKMIYPGMLIMIACLAVTVAPFLIKFVEFFE